MKKMSAIIIIVILNAILWVFAQEKTEPASNSNLTPAQIAGKHLFALKKCSDCHNILGEEAADGITAVFNKRDDDWFAAHVRDESTIVLRQEKSKRKRKRVLREEIKALDAYLFGSAADKKQIDGLPENVFLGAYFVYQNSCLNCHAIAGFGKDVAPDLSTVGKKHEKEWLIENFKDPKQFKDDTIMPSFSRLDEKTLGNMADYLGTLK